MNQDNLPFAHVYARSAGTYGHLYIDIRNVVDYSGMRLKLTSQCGGSSGTLNRGMYAVNYGFESFSSDVLKLEELEIAVKFMRKVEKKMANFNEQLGYADTYAKTAQRLLIAAGVTEVYVDEVINSSRNIKDNVCYHGQHETVLIGETIKELEEAILTRHCGLLVA